MRLRSLFLPALVSLAIAWAPAALSANDTMSSADMVNLLRSAKAVNPKSPLHVAVGDKEVIVLTKREGKMTDNDCKIDATFVAKTLIDAAPEQIARVKVLFSHENDDKCDQVVVGAGDVKSYGSGQITEDQLLHSLELTSAEDKGGGVASTPASVAPGPLQERRLLLLNRIQALKEKGTGVKPFEALFQKVEEMAKTGVEKDVQAAVDDLSDKLKAQEQLRKQAAIGHYQPVKHSGPSAPTTQSTPSLPPWMRGQNGQGQGFRAGQGIAGQGIAGQGYTPGQDAGAIMMKIRQRIATMSPNEKAEFEIIEKMKHTGRYQEAEQRLRDFGRRLGL